MDFPDSGSKLNSLWRIHSRFMKGWWCRTKSIRSAPPPLSIQSHERRVVLTSCLRSDTPMTAKRALAHPSESAVRRFLAGQDVVRPVRHCGIPLGRAERASPTFSSPQSHGYPPRSRRTRLHGLPAHSCSVPAPVPHAVARPGRFQPRPGGDCRHLRPKGVLRNI